MNWYKSCLKTARRGTDRPLMDDYSRVFGPEKEPYSLTKANPFFGGKERFTPDGKGYPKGISQFEDEAEDDFTGYRELQPGRTILDDEIMQGEGANDERFFSDEDKMPIKKEKEPIGPHNMQSRIQSKDIFDVVSRKSKLRNLNKV